MESANVLRINFRRGCSALEIRLDVGEGAFGRGLAYSLASCCGVRARSWRSKWRDEGGCNAAKAPNHRWGGNGVEGASVSARFGDMLGMKGSSSGYGPNMCAIILLNQSETFLWSSVVASREMGGMR